MSNLLLGPKDIRRGVIGDDGRHVLQFGVVKVDLGRQGPSLGGLTSLFGGKEELNVIDAADQGPSFLVVEVNVELFACLQ